MAVKVRKIRGQWRVVVDYKGIRQSRNTGSKKAAEVVARQLEAKLALGDMGFLEEKPPAAPAFDDYAAQWLATHATHSCKESIYTRYEGVVRNYLIPAFGNRPLTGITRADVKQFIYRLQETTDLTLASLRQIVAPLRSILNHGVEDKILVSNPAAQVGRFLKQRQTPKRKIDPLSREELALFLGTVQEHAPDYYPLFLCLARTGMRLGEALALQWGDIDFRKRFIEVQRNYVRGRITQPKNGRTRRVDMSNQLGEALRDLRTQRQVEAAVQGAADIAEWTFCSATGGLLDPANVRKRVFYPCLNKAEMRRVRIHDLRHTYASLLIQQGESLIYIKENLGHHSTDFTLRTYGHLLPGGNKAAVDRLDDAPIRNLSATSAHQDVDVSM